MRPRSVAVMGGVALFWVGLIVMKGLASGPAAGTSGRWTPAGTLTQPRTGVAAVLLDDERVLVTGGSFTPGPGADGTPPGPPIAVSTVDIYAGTAGFSAAPPMNTARSHHSAVRLRDGRVLVAGGITVSSDGTADAATATAELFDPAAGTWTPVGNMAEARSRHTASLLADGRVLIAGGEDGGAARATLEVFDPATLTFSAAGVTALARKDHAAATLADGRVLLAGGSDDGGVLASIEIYDPVAATIVSAAMSGPRTGLTATRLLDGTVLMAGGNDGTQDLATAEVFDPATSASTLTGAMTSPRRGHQAFLLPNNNSVLLVGGASSGMPLASAELFWPPALAFHATGSMASARANATGTPLRDDGRLLIAGGANAERYAFATIGTDWDDYAPGETVFMTGQGWEPGETVTLVLHEAQHPDGHDDRIFTVVADETGFIYNDEFAPDLDDLGVRFYVTATGSVSQAQTTFTDGELITAELVGTANDVTVSQGSTANFTIRVSANTPDTIKCVATQANPANATVRTVFSISASGLLSSSTPSSPLAFYAAPGTQHGNGQNCDITWTGAPTAYSVAASVSAAATTPLGNYTIALGATAGTTTVSTPAGQGDGLADATPTTITVHVVAPADSTPPVITPNVSGTPGSNGWYISDVTVSWSVTDPESSISSSTGCTTSTVNTDTTGVTFTCTATSTGGTSTNSVTVKRDATAPTAALSITAGTAGAHGWYTSDVTVHTSGSDAISSPIVCTGDQQQTAETSGTPFNGSCTNDAGLTTNAAPITVKLDKTGPTAQLSVTAGTAGANGWYTSDVTVHTDGTDTISGPVTCTADQNQTAETASTPFNGSCTNDAGLKTDAASLTIKLDKTGPTAQLSVTAGTAGAHGWYTSDVTIHASGTDTISGPVTCTADQHQTAETAGVVFHGSCTNDAGLSAEASALTVKLDKTGPTGVSSTVTGGTLGQHGWYITDITVHTTGTEDISGPAHCTNDQTIATETAAQNVAGSCTNDAGLTTDAAPLPIKLDKTGPSAELAVAAGTAGANGWFTSDVTLHATGTDAISSPVTCSADQHQATETTGAAFNASCTNDAGLTTNAAPITIKLDKTPPSATLSASGTAGLNGWFTSDVTVNTTGSDSISSPVVCTTAQTQTTDTTGTTFHGSCTNNAGLEGQAAALLVKVDKTPPVISLVAPANGGSYTLNASVPSNYSCTDATSGTASCSGPVASGANFSTSPIGSNTFQVTAKDQAGNTATQSATYGVKFATGVCLGELGHSVLQPINVDGSSVFKQKSTVPVKFRVCDANGLSIASGAVADFRLVQIISGTNVNSVNEFVDSTTPDTTFRWDPSSQQWIFNANTKSLSASMTYVYVITLTDATTIQYRFGLK